MQNIILIAVILIIVGGAALYIYRAKKRGNHCIGCPHGGQCGRKQCGCGHSEEDHSKP